MPPDTRWKRGLLIQSVNLFKSAGYFNSYWNPCKRKEISLSFQFPRWKTKNKDSSGKIRPFFNGKGPKIVSFLKCRPPSTVLNNIPEVKGSGKIENEIPRKPTTKHSDWLVTCKCFHHAMRGKFEKASVAQKHSAFSRQLSFSLLL